MQSILLLVTCLLASSPNPLLAASLQVAPVSIVVLAPSSTGQLNLRNQGDNSINVQIRVFRWTQFDGEEQLLPTDDLVVSPPAAAIAAGQNHVVRLVRVSKEPINGEESYRLLIDEVPDFANQDGATVNFAIRYSLPIFFQEAEIGPQLVWTVEASEESLRITARNNGTQHVRIAELSAEAPSGQSISYGEGLNGYVLANSTKSWSAPASGMMPGTTLELTARGGNEQISAEVTLPSSNE